MEDKKISIIIPVYNMAHLIGETLESIINQDYKNIEILIVDDGSTDDSLNVIRQFKEKDQRITIFEQKNQGAGPARNLGIVKSSGDFLLFPDADDLLEPNLISYMTEFMGSKNLDVAMYSWKEFYKEKTESKISQEHLEGFEFNSQDDLRKSYIDLYLNGISHATNNKMYRADIIRKNKIFFPALRRSQDIGFNNQVFDYARKFHKTEKILYNYRVSQSEVYKKKIPHDILEINIILHKQIRELLQKWGNLDKSAELRLANKLILNFIVYLAYYDLPIPHERYIELKKAISTDEFRKALSIIKNQKSLLSVFVEIFEKKQIRTAIILSKIKKNISENFPKIREILKGII